MTEANTFQIGQREIPYILTESPGSKTVHLKLTPDLKLEISVPSGLKNDLPTILRRKRSWIEKKYDELAKSRRIFDGKRVLYRGEYRDQEDTFEASKEWLSSETEKIVQGKIRQFGRRFKLSSSDFVVKDTKKWAFCTKGRRLVFNWQLAALPDELVDYVVLHELIHLREFSHSKRFKYMLAAVCPDFKDKEIMLKRFIAE